MKKKFIFVTLILTLPFLSGCGGYDWIQADSFRVHQGDNELNVFLQTTNGVKDPSVFFDCEKDLSEIKEEIKTQPSSQTYLIGDVLYLVPNGQENSCYRVMHTEADGNRFIADSSTAHLTISSTEHYRFVFPYHYANLNENSVFDAKENVSYAVDGTYTDWKAFYDLMNVRYSALDKEQALVLDSYSLESNTEYKESIRISFQDGVSFSFVANIE